MKIHSDFRFIYIILLCLSPIVNNAVLLSKTPTIEEQIQQSIDEENYAQSINLLEMSIQKNRDNSENYRLYALLMMKMKNYNQAISNIQKALLLSKNNTTNLMTAGNIYRELKDYTEAQNYYEKVLKLDPTFAQIYFEYAQLNVEQLKLIEAERLLKLSQSFNPNSWQNTILSAKIAQIKNSFKEAQQIFFNAIEKFPKQEEIFTEFAEFYLKNDQDMKALAILKESNKKFGDKASRNEAIGDILAKTSQYQEAMNFYQKSMEQYSKTRYTEISLLQWKLYNIYKLMNKEEEAEKILKQAFEFSPLNQLYIAAYSHLLVSSRAPTDPFREKLALYLEKLAQQERKKGISIYYASLLKKVIELSPSKTTARNHLIEYAKIKKNEYAVNDLLKKNAQNQNNNPTLDRIIQLRNHLEKTKRLDQKKIMIYQYTNLVFIQNKTDQIALIMGQEILSLESFFPNILSIIELKKNFKQESQTLFQNNTAYNIITDIQIDPKQSLIFITIYDKLGLPFFSIKHNYDNQRITETLIDYLHKLSLTLPHAGYITNRLPNSTFTTTLGTINNISNNSILTVLDENLQPITTMIVIDAKESYSIVKLNNGLPKKFFDFNNSLVVASENIPSITTNTNTNTNTNKTKIVDFLRVGQKKSPTEIKFSHQTEPKFQESGEGTL